MAPTARPVAADDGGGARVLDDVPAGAPGPVGDPDVPGEAGRYGKADAALLALPLDHLPRPLLVESAVLGERIYLCADDRQAEGVRASGLVTYTADEVDELRRTGMTPEGMRAVHEAKRWFPGRVVRGDATDVQGRLADGNNA